MAFLYPTRGPAGGCCSVWWPGYVPPWAPSRVHLVGRSRVPLVSEAQREVCLRLASGDGRSPARSHGLLAFFPVTTHSPRSGLDL